VIVTAPNFLHHQICLAALEAGCDVIKEKPLDITLEGGLKLVNQAKKLGRMIMTTQQRYHSPLFQEAKNLLAYIGRLHHFSYIFTLDDHQQSWYWEREKSGGGSWLNIGWHGISTLSWLLGDITQVALAENSGGKRPWTYTTDHSSLAKLVLDNSVNGTAFFSCVYPKEEQLLIYGSTGRLEINRKQIRLQSPQLQIEMKVAAEEEGVYLKQLHFLLNAWQTHNYNMDRDLKILQVIQAGTNSFSQGGRYEKC
jgi:predicted dehydrogenase